MTSSKVLYPLKKWSTQVNKNVSLIMYQKLTMTLYMKLTNIKDWENSLLVLNYNLQVSVTLMSYLFLKRIHLEPWLSLLVIELAMVLELVFITFVLLLSLIWVSISYSKKQNMVTFMMPSLICFIHSMWDQITTSNSDIKEVISHVHL